MGLVLSLPRLVLAADAVNPQTGFFFSEVIAQPLYGRFLFTDYTVEW